MSPRRSDDEDYYPSPEHIRDLVASFSELLKDEKIKTGIAASLNSIAASLNGIAVWLNAQANKKPLKMPRLPYYAGLLFGLCVFAGIVCMAAHHILSSESTTVLIGALIAAWWGGQKPPPK